MFLLDYDFNSCLYQNSDLFLFQVSPITLLPIPPLYVLFCFLIMKCISCDSMMSLYAFTRITNLCNMIIAAAEQCEKVSFKSRRCICVLKHGFLTTIRRDYCHIVISTVIYASSFTHGNRCYLPKYKDFVPFLSIVINTLYNMASFHDFLRLF